MNKFLFLLFPIGALAQIPSYYEGINFSRNNPDLQAEISDLVVATHRNQITYTPGVWNLISASDLSLDDPDKVLLIYGYDDLGEQKVHRTRNTELKNEGGCGSCIGRWEREHVFPKSLANPPLDTDEPSAGTDAHNLRAVDRQMNSSRSNKPFIDGSGNARLIGTGFYPGDEWKGDVARILMYMHVRYNEADVQICDPNRATTNTTNTSHNSMPDLLLKWNSEDPPSEFEMIRNEVIFSTQGNRNPFIDNPYIATLTWGGVNANNTWTELSTSDYLIEDIQISIAPNPTSDVVNVIGKNIEFINLYNTTGMLLQSNLKNNFSIAQYPAGIYFLAIHLSNGKIITQKVIKK